MHGASSCHRGTAMLAGNGADCDVAEAGVQQQWYALAVKPRHDKAVSKTLENKGLQTLVPLYKKRHQYAARSRETELPLFPGYVFCRFSLRARLPVLITPGVIQILGAGRLPIPVDEAEMESLQTALRLRLPIQPHSFLEAGQRVHITEGALAGIEGVVMSDKPALRVVLSITLLRRSVLLEIARDCVSTEGIRQ
jgi:transcription antitermination factor NusG